MNDNNNDELFTINDFAKACKTTKDTLYHYEKNDILRPTIDATNHYRYYSILDFHRFQFIAHLRNLGFSVSEIRDYQNHRSVNGYIELLNQVREKTLEEIDRLNKRLSISSYTQQSMVNYMSTPINVPSIFSLKEGYYFMSPFSGSLNSLTGIQEMSEHLEKLIQKPSKTAPIVAIKMEVNEVATAETSPISFISHTTSPELFEKESIYYRPAGSFLHEFFNMDLLSSNHEDITDCFKKMAVYAEKHNYHFTTDLFCINRVNRFVTNEESEFLMELFIGVE